MTQDYKVLLTGIIVFKLIIVSKLMLFDMLGASEVATSK